MGRFAANAVKYVRAIVYSLSAMRGAPPLERDRFRSKSPSRSRFLLAHDLFRKPVSTFRDHALAPRLPRPTLQRVVKRQRYALDFTELPGRIAQDRCVGCRRGDKAKSKHRIRRNAATSGGDRDQPGLSRARQQALRDPRQRQLIQLRAKARQPDRVLAGASLD